MRNASPMKPQPKETPKKRIGAERATSSLRNRIDSWLAHHRESSRDALRRLWRRPVATALTLFTLAIALALPAGLSMLVQNVHQVTGDWGGNAHLSVFLKQSASLDAQQKLAREWSARADIERVETITPDQALAEYRAQSDSSDILAALPDNPLPPVLVVYPHAQQADDLQQLAQQLQQAPQVDKVILDVAWIRKLHAFIQLAERLISALTLALGAGIILVINNTLQLAIESRRDEIIVMKTVGGTNGFVRRPFLYTGFWYGVGGGLLALVLVGIAFAFIGYPANELLSLYDAHRSVSGLPLSTFLLLPLLAGLLGLLGAFLAVSRHIHDLEPRQF
jgi:cell division transport system permease protein